MGRLDHIRPQLIALALVAALLACGDTRESSAQQAHADSVAAAGGRVDSALTIAEHLRRFRAIAGPSPDSLRHASRSADDLVKRWAAAISARDTAALREMTVDLAEFAWFFYPETRMSRPPYEMPPALLWSQLTTGGGDGLRAALARLGGKRLTVRSLRCPAPADTEGPNILRQGCVVGLSVAGDTLPEDRYFGSILERAGRLKFLSMTNKL